MNRKDFTAFRNRLFQPDGKIVRIGSVVCGRGWLRFWGQAMFGIVVDTGQAFAMYDEKDTDEKHVSTAETNCARGRRKSVPVGLREKSLAAMVEATGALWPWPLPDGPDLEIAVSESQSDF